MMYTHHLCCWTLHKTLAIQKSVKAGSLQYDGSLGKCCPAAIGKHLPVCWHVATATIEDVDEEEESIDWASRFQVWVRPADAPGPRQEWELNDFLMIIFNRDTFLKKYSCNFYICNFIIHPSFRMQRILKLIKIIYGLIQHFHYSRSILFIKKKHNPLAAQIESLLWS